MKSASNADNNKSPQEERFSTPLTVLGIVLSFLLLLIALFPEKKIIREISGTGELSPVRLNYRESLLRQDPENVPLRLKLAEDLVKISEFRKALHTLDGFAGVPRGKDRIRYLQARCKALSGILSLKGNQPESEAFRNDLSRSTRELADNGVAPELLLSLAGDLKRIGDEKGSRLLMHRYVMATASQGEATKGAGEGYASALPGSYRERAELYFSAMEDARTPEMRRALFMRGVRSLLAGGVPEEALSGGESHLGPLATDRPTLIFMANIALGAARPAVAQIYIKKALGMET